MNEEDAGQALQASNLINKKILEFNTATSWNRKTQVPNYTFNLTSNCNFFLSNIFWAMQHRMYYIFSNVIIKAKFKTRKLFSHRHTIHLEYKSTKAVKID